MSVITKPHTFSSGATIFAAQHNSNFDTIYNDYNGNITNANVDDNAAISGSKVDFSDPGPIGGTIPSTGDFTTISTTGLATLDSITTGTGATIDEFSTDGTLAGNSDTAVPTEKAVKTAVDGVDRSFGSWLSRTKNTTYQATTDGFVTCFSTGDAGGTGTHTGYTDANSTPTTVRCKTYYLAAAAEVACFTMPVKSGDYWRVTTTTTGSTTIFWIPLG